jgi:hypothetical protein
MIPDPDRTRWAVRLNSRDLMVFQGPNARICAEREADAREQRIALQLASRADLDPTDRM